MTLPAVIDVTNAVLRRMLELLEIDHLLPVYPSISEACEPPPGSRHPMPFLHPAPRPPDTCHSERRSPAGMTAAASGC